MQLNYFKGLLTVMALLLILNGCGSGSQEEKQEKAEEPAQISTIVCLWDQVPVREEPLRAGKWLSALNLGETVEDLGENSVDEADNNRNYFKIRLSDGTIGWAPDYGLEKGEAAAITSNTYVNRRPDLLTATNVEFAPMEFIVIAERTDDWVEVMGERKQKKGWIEARHITTDREEVAIAVLARKNVFTENTLDYAKLETFMQTTPFTQTAFYRYLDNLLETHLRDERLKKEVEEELGKYNDGNYEDELDEEEAEKEIAKKS